MIMMVKWKGFMRFVGPVASLLILFIVGCVHEYPDGEGNKEMAIEWRSNHLEELLDVHLWMFNKDDLLEREYVFATSGELASNLILSGENCTLVAATCPVEYYSCEIEKGVTRLSDLRVMLKDVSSNPPHVQSGIVAVASQENKAVLSLVRVLSELQFTIKNIPSDVVKIRAEVLNCARGFYPGVNRLDGEITTVLLGEVIPIDGIANFPMRRLMPVVSGGKGRIEVTYSTRMSVTITYGDATTTTFEVEAPALQNNGTYEPEIQYEWLRKGVVLQLTEINGWGSSDEISGETTKSL